MNDTNSVDMMAALFQDTWKQLAQQTREAGESQDGAQLLRAEGGRAVLMHIAKSLGYTTEVQKETADGKGTAQVPASNQPSRRKGKKKASKAN